nr:transcriptional regulator MntR [Candidatus Pantoea persica]
MLSVLRPFLHDRILHLLLIVGALLMLLANFHWAALPGAVDWHTIVTLTGLLLLTKGLETSGYFDVLGARLIGRFRHERTLALFMVLAAALLSTFFTNDVALFILVPLTLTLRKFSRLPLSLPADYFRGAGGQRRLAADAGRQSAKPAAVESLQARRGAVYRADGAACRLAAADADVVQL